MFNYTVKSLIEKLKEYPEDMPVLVDGYKDGFDNIHNISSEEVYYHDSPYCGEFESKEYLEYEDEREVYTVLTIDR
jgi:hypothetical protein